MAQFVAAAPIKRKLPFPVELYRSAVGKKYAMAVSGLFLILFVVGHMVGNLKLYLGKTVTGTYHVDEYGEFLRRLAEPILPHTVALWIIRVVLIGAFVLHMHAAYSLTMMNRRARTVTYQRKSDYQAANFASRSMRWTGIIVILFLIFHLLDITWGKSGASWTRGAVFSNVDNSLSRWPIAIFYVLANLALGVHLYHGAWSFFQSLGWNNPRFNAWRRKFAVGLAGLIVLGNISFPIAFVTGLVGR